MTQEEMVQAFEKSGIEDAERWVRVWTFNTGANSIGQIMTVLIDKADKEMRLFIKPAKSPAKVGMAAYDASYYLDCVYKLTCIGYMPEPLPQKDEAK